MWSMNIMTIMKKKLIKITIILLVIITTIVSIIIMNIHNNKQTRFINYPNNYSICNTKDLEVIIYSNVEKLECFNKNNISNIILEDIDGNIYQALVNDIELREKEFVEDDYYYPYHMRLSMTFSSDSIINMKDVKLIITTKMGDKMSFNIGNISVVNMEFASLVDTKSITSKTKKIDEYYTLDTITIELYNKQYNEVILSNIILVSNVVNTNDFSLKLDVGENYFLDIKLNYLDNLFIDHIGIILEWEFKGNIYQQLISPYRLFKTSSKHTVPIIQTYEVY